MKDDRQELLNEVLADSADTITPARAALERVAALVSVMRDAQRRVDEAETAFKRQKAELLQVATIDLPELLRESGLSEVALEDGTKVKVVDEITCGITADRAPAAHAWLREAGMGGVIKTEVTVAFGKDSITAADALFVRLLGEYGSDSTTETEKVHPSTLKALLKELLEKGHPFPLDLFAVQPYSIAKLSTVKPRKGAA